jgi:hypothetical protein
MLAGHAHGRQSRCGALRLARPTDAHPPDPSILAKPLRALRARVTTYVGNCGMSPALLTAHSMKCHY